MKRRGSFGGDDGDTLPSTAPRGSGAGAGANGSRRSTARSSSPVVTPLRVALALVVLGLLVVAANFAVTWRATSFSRAEAAARLSRLESDGVGHTDHEQLDALDNGGLGNEPLLRRGDTETAESGSFSDEEAEAMEKQLVYTLHQVSQQTSEPRGIVLPLFDGIATLGLSLIMELRAMSVDLPVEIPHCGDLGDAIQRAVGEKEDLGVVRFYDVCELAAETVGARDASRKVFCQSLRNCHRAFRSFDVKLLSVAFSRFEELMLLDADTIFFQSPMPLWETRQFRDTGTLFFHDRLSQDDMFLGNRERGKPDVSELNRYVSRFDPTPFKPLGAIARPAATSANQVDVELGNYSPSEHLLTSHSWNHRAGHEMDSSLVLWSKTRQPRATALLLAFVAQNKVPRPPSYGDKELFFLAAELAETQYGFSDFGVGGVGTDFRDYGPDKSVVCGDAAHYYPELEAAGAPANASVLYLNSDRILEYAPKKQPVYVSAARPYALYPGSFVERDLPQECPFDVTGVALSAAQEDRVLLRQRFHEIATAWME